MFRSSTFCLQSAFKRFVCVSEQTATGSSLYSIKRSAFITERKGVYCAVGTGHLQQITLRP